METPVEISHNNILKEYPQLDEWMSKPENYQKIKQYSSLTSKDNQPMLYIPDLVRQGQKAANDKILVTEPTDLGNSLTFKVGGIVFENFPKPVRYPAFIVDNISKIAGNKRDELLSVPVRYPFDEQEFNRWFTIGKNAYVAARETNDQSVLCNLAFIHLASFVWGGIGFEKYFNSQEDYVKNGNLNTMMGRVYRYRKESQLPFGNYKQ